MALITRLSRLLRADAHAVLDHIEDPEAVLRQAVRDMQTEVAHAEQRILMSQQELEQREQQIARTEQQIKRYSEQLDDCFDAQREDLARSVLRQRLQHESKLEPLQAFTHQHRETLDNDRAQLANRRGVLESTEQKLAVLGRSNASAAPTRSSAQATTAPISDEQVDLELVREKKLRKKLDDKEVG